jgi:transposase-like protein
MTDNQPKTLQQAMVYFADKQNAHDFIVSLRWSDGVICPHCGGKEQWFIKTRLIWRCKSCNKQFSVKVGTIFEDSALGLDKWLCAIWMIANAKNGISSHELGRALGVTQKSAWFMLHRIRLAMQEGSLEKFSGEIETDETYIGGEVKNMHEWKRLCSGIQGRGTVGKAIVSGVLQRGTKDAPSKVRTTVVKNVKKHTLHKQVKNNVEAGSTLYTDELKSYEGLNAEYIHHAINHAVEYVNGNIHTNGMENYWSLFKRALRGTYVTCDSEHLFRYLDEENFRFNNRKDNDANRFALVLGSVAGKRLTYAELIASETYKQLNFFKRVN